MEMLKIDEVIKKWEKEKLKVYITDEDEYGKWYENEWSHGRYGAINEFLNDLNQLKLNLTKHE